LLPHFATHSVATATPPVPLACSEETTNNTRVGADQVPFHQPHFEKCGGTPCSISTSVRAVKTGLSLPISTSMRDASLWRLKVTRADKLLSPWTFGENRWRCF